MRYCQNNSAGDEIEWQPREDNYFGGAQGELLVNILSNQSHLFWTSTINCGSMPEIYKASGIERAITQQYSSGRFWKAVHIKFNMAL